MADSPRSVYVRECERFDVSCNSGIRSTLAENPEAFDAMHQLDLSRNCVGCRGLLPVLSVIEKCRNLEVLNLEGNCLSNDNISELCRALKSHENLRRLSLSANPISYAAGKSLLGLIREKTELRDVELVNTLMNPALANLVSLTARNKGHPKHAERISDEERHLQAVRVGVSPDDDWYAMETIWNLAAVAAPAPTEGWAGLASVMALVRHDISLASMYTKPSPPSQSDGSYHQSVQQSQVIPKEEPKATER